MELHHLDAADAAGLTTFCALSNAAHAVDAPWMYADRPAVLASLIRQGWDGDPIPRALVTVDGVAVGGASLEISTRENLELAWAHFFIAPEHRRRGHGRALWQVVLDWADTLGRPLVGTDTWEGTAGEAFADAIGLTPKAWAICRVQDVAAVDREALAELRDEAAAACSSYEILRMRGRTPVELLPELAVLQAAINDAPIDDLEWDDEVYDAARVAAIEDAFEAAGFDHFRVVARHRETGELSGHTQVLIQGGSLREGHQGDTAVARAHRGHRLGLALKVDMLEWLAEEAPELRSLITWNAEVNDHMIAVNETLGYRVVGRQLEYQTRR